MTTTFLNLPPHLLNSAALWQPSGQNTSSPPQLLTSSTPPLSGTPSGQNTSSPPQLHRSLAPQWTKYLLNSSIPPLSGTPSGQNTSSPPQLHRSLASPVEKIPPHLLPSSIPPLSGTPSGENTCSPPQFRHSLVPPVEKIPSHLLNFTILWRPKWPPPCSLAAQVAPNLLFGATKWCSLAPQVSLSHVPSGALWRFSWQPPLLSSAL